jgi:hypothetical protein
MLLLALQICIIDHVSFQRNKENPLILLQKDKPVRNIYSIRASERNLLTLFTLRKQERIELIEKARQC